MKFILAAAVGLYVASAHDGACGFQCKTDGDCGKCGVAGSGKCSCPDGDATNFPTISCSCVSQPANPPPGDTNVTDSHWPQQWTADVEAFSYPDFADATVVAKGKFYYDGVGDHSRADWSPYTSGKDATQVWIAGTGDTESPYYVLSGGVCIYFPITDPGTTKNIGLESSDWMEHCDQTDWAKFIAREQVLVDGKLIWADHWVCHIEYAAVNQTITFQNWHSLGLDSVEKGLPVRVTGGNSAPDPQQGSPRMNTVWYTNFKTGPSSVDPSEFEKPAKFCIPVAQDKVEEFFGTTPTKEHAFNPQFHKRAHFLPHHEPNEEDVARAVKPTPHPHFKGATFEDAMEKLNGMLKKDWGLKTRKCSDFTLPELFETMDTLYHARSPALNQVYVGAADTRSMAHASTEEMLASQAKFEAMVAARPSVEDIVRDGLCHEAVMWYVHHLSLAARTEAKLIVTLPLLPATLHTAPEGEHELAARYQDQVSCAVCHLV